jgi:hypothetical protein
MMGRLRLTAVEAAVVVLDDGDDTPVHSQWALVGKVLAPNTLHIHTIASALRPAWGNPRGLVLNSAGDDLFVAEFGTKADKDRVANGPPWVVGKHAVLLQNFSVDLRPRDMIFNSLKVWARIINLPFGYMHKRWGALIAGSLGIEGSVPFVDADATGRCWGSFMRVQVEVNVDKPLMRGVTVYSQRRHASDWFEVQYENLPHYCFSCGIIGHSSLECKNPGDRDVDGKLPYSADRLCAPDERKKKNQGAGSSVGSASAGVGRASPSSTTERPTQSANSGGVAGQPKQSDTNSEALPPVKKKQPRASTSNTKARRGQSKEPTSGTEGGSGSTGQKLKSQNVYRVKAPPAQIEGVVNPLALVVHQKAADPSDDVAAAGETLSTDSNKKLRKSTDNGSADQAGAVDQPHQTQ